MQNRAGKRLQPTTWRTCRVLANRTRLALLREVIKRPGHSVAAAAEVVNIRPELASKYLRDLNARGLLKVQRIASRVLYSAEADRSVPQAHALLKEITWVFQNNSNAVEHIFRLVTAFTHPRRILIVATIASGRGHFAELCRTNSISSSALARHLLKLKDRGIVRQVNSNYDISPGLSPLAAVLVALCRGH